MTTDYWLLAAPVVGTLANVAAQLVLARIVATERLLALIAMAFGVGLVVTGAMAAIAVTLDALPALDAVALVVSVLFIYGAAGLVLFSIINLGETSLRIRMMRVLLDAPEGVRREALMSTYDDRALIGIRLQRLRDNAQARVENDFYYARPSFLFAAAATVRLLKRIVYGRR